MKEEIEAMLDPRNPVPMPITMKDNPDFETIRLQNAVIRLAEKIDILENVIVNL